MMWVNGMMFFLNGITDNKRRKKKKQNTKVISYIFPVLSCEIPTRLQWEMNESNVADAQIEQKHNRGETWTVF